ncbi:MAG: aminotransferase class V-fold PLP-dependent enzyme [Bacteroidales bacterium]|nr:aminotransferase class V-fold PLP-dependent enzyme [Bacteroidales bacterium]
MDKNINQSKMPVYRDAGFSFYRFEDIEQIFGEEKSNSWQPEKYIYSRYRNPTVTHTEQKLAKLENSNWSILSASGMASIDMAISILYNAEKKSNILFFSEIYGGTISYMNYVLKQKRGVDFGVFNTENGVYNLNKLDELLSSAKYTVLYFEAVSNPFLVVSDAKEIIRIAKKYNVKVIVDNTFATSILWKPVENGADLVVHSVTKYLSGHGSITAGVLSGNAANLLHEAIEYRKLVGAILSPDDAWRIAEQLDTFEMRVKKHNKNALKVAQFLDKHPKISTVIYPGLESDNFYNEAKKLFNNKGFGGMLTFEIAGKNEEAKKAAVIKYLNKSKESIPIIPSMGETQTIQLPIYAVWKDRSPSPSYIRLSVGIENVDEIILNLENALK